MKFTRHISRGLLTTLSILLILVVRAVQLPIKDDGKKTAIHQALQTYAAIDKWDESFSSKTAKINQSEASELKYLGAEIDIKKGGLLNHLEQISITPLREADCPALDIGMSNVTDKSIAYRFLPNGEHFKEGLASIKLKYDPTKIPSGYTEDDIRTYYFNIQTGHWEALKRLNIDKEKKIIISELRHFTDMINGVIRTPESPESMAYTPSTMQGIKAADPATKINLIKAPSVSSSGSANIGYPIELPAGRQGMQPSLNISYSSDGGNGWIGKGWDIHIPLISVDTRWGVPRYDKQLETETYNLQGTMLVGVENGKTFVAHKGEEINRKENRKFYKRINTNYEQIIRKGSSPDNYTWEITDKSGTKYYYGGITELDSNAVLRDPTTKNIAQWHLVRVQDAEGNFVQYHYQAISKKVFNKLYAQAVYCQSITYTGYGNNEGHYKIKFERTDGATSRKDQRTNAKYGFLTLPTYDLLRKISIWINDEKIRSYKLSYIEGAFFKTLLKKIEQYDAEDQFFNQHEFEYYDHVQRQNRYKTFAKEETWTAGNKYISAGLINQLSKTPLSVFTDNLSALGGGKTTSLGTAVYGGVGISLSDNSKNLTAGSSFGFSISKTKAKISMTDINGDGLPDKIVKEGNDLYYLPNLGNGIFGYRKEISGIDEFSETFSRSWNIGARAYAVGLSSGAEKSFSKSTTSVYFADVNADGLIDVVSKGKVYFNHYNPSTGKVTFKPTSVGTPAPIDEKGGKIDISGGAVNPQEQQEMIDNNPLHDVVRVWRAPYKGKIKINAPVKLLQLEAGYNKEKYEKADGLRVAIQYNNIEIWNAQIEKTDFLEHSPTLSPIKVNKGDKIFFRVQSGTNDKANGDFDKVEWNPSINYTDTSEIIDYNGRKAYTYNAQENFLFTQANNLLIPSSINNLRLEGEFTKPPTTDDVRIRITEKNTNTIIYDSTFAANQEVNKLKIERNNLIFSKIDTLPSMYKFEMIATSEIAWKQIKWQPKMLMQQQTQLEGQTINSDFAMSPTVSKQVFARPIQVGEPYTITKDTANAIRLLANIEFEEIPYPALQFVDKEFNIYASVKKQNELVAKTLIKAKLTDINARTENKKVELSPIAFDSIDIKGVRKDDKIWVEYSIDSDTIAYFIKNTDAQIIEKLIFKDSNEVERDSAVSDTTKINSFTYSRDKDLRFGNMYGNWGQFAYNSMNGRARKPINTDLLVLPKDTSHKPNPIKDVFIPLVQDKTQTQKRGYDAATYISHNTMSASRLGEKDVVLFNPFERIANLMGMGKGVYAVDKISKSTNTTKNAGLFVANSSISNGKDKQLYDYMDMNGDGFPDILDSKQIQYTNSRGALSGEKTSISGIHQSKNNSKNVGIGGLGVQSFSPNSQTSIASRQVASGIKAWNIASNNSSVKINMGISFNKDQTEQTFMDINGDGLPDRVRGKEVEINTGYGFLPAVTWTNNFNYVTYGNSNSQNAGLGFDIKSSSISGGIGLNRGDNSNEFALMDMNADGLPDKVSKRDGKIYVSLNTGLKFEDEILWDGISDLGKTSSVGESTNSAATISIYAWLLRIAINPSQNIGQSANRVLSTFKDIDGDGFPDYLSAENSGEIKVKKSTIEHTNYLKTIKNPLGGQIQIAYKRTPPSYKHPQGKRVLATVTIKDGLSEDGADIKTSYDYKNGKYDREERTFLGFEKVETKQINTQQNKEKVYRKNVQTYANNNYYEQGQLLKTELQTPQGKTLSRQENQYLQRSILPKGNSYITSGYLDSKSGIVFSPLQYTRSTTFEQNDSLVLNEADYQYGDYGEITQYRYSDKGNIANYNYKTTISYNNLIDKHILSLPKQVEVRDQGGTLLRKSTAQYNPQGKAIKISQELNPQGEKAETDLEYDRYGNITKRTLPANHKGERMHYEYRYEPVLHSYLQRISDAFGYYTRFNEYDYRFGQVLESQDINGFYISYKTDPVGRITEVLAPNEEENGVPYTIKNEYYPQEASTNEQDELTKLAYAKTLHYDPQHPSDPLQTFTFADGLGRAVQVKKEAIVGEIKKHGGKPEQKEKYIISGRVRYDAFGRAIASYHPSTEDKGTENLLFNKNYDQVAPTLTRYDLQDRTIATILPNGSQSTMQYGIDQATRTLKSTLTDALGNKKISYTNGSGLTLKTKEEEGITTQYYYDAINQLLQVQDANGNNSYNTYDMAGRRSTQTQPDAGTTHFSYDQASNLISKQTANLADEGLQINYTYDHNRLIEVNYPKHPENNVRYHYGKRNASHNRVGRITLQEDGTGAVEFFYGKMGEINKTIRTVVIPNNAIATFTTQWKYDSWNRVQEMIYPDGEKLTYHYNKGGQLQSLTGHKHYTYGYVQEISYDKFEQRNYLRYCNGAETTYEYDELRRLQHLKAWTGKDAQRRNFMHNSYTYDQANNLSSVSNLATLPSDAQAQGGQMQHNYSYDKLYRLTQATGEYQGYGKKTANYSLQMSYDKLHNIINKEQHISQSGVVFSGKLQAGYSLQYHYGNKPHQLSHIADSSYSYANTDSTPATHTHNQYSYDANGNLIHINIQNKGHKLREEQMTWDEENRLTAVSKNGYVSLYTYDANGERTVKLSGSGQEVFVNSQYSGSQTATNRYTAYISPYFVLQSGGQYTKHIMIGTQRVVSKLGEVSSFGQDPRRVPYAGETAKQKVDYKLKYSNLQKIIRNKYKLFKVPYKQKDNDNYQNNDNFCCGNKGENKDDGITDNEDPELNQFYYHSDHLGSSSYITNLKGSIVQHVEYVPFGEVFLEERNNKWNTPYLFNGKELDEETGLYYYGARYYSSRNSIFLSVDPLAEKYPGISPYCYTMNNPVKFIDPDGRDIIPVHGTWSDINTWGNLSGITKASNNLFGDNNLGNSFAWSGANYAQLRTKAAIQLVDHARTQMQSEDFNGKITLVGHSHGGNVSIEALNMMAEMEEFDNVQLNLLTINTPAREDYQLSEKATGRVSHTNVYDPKDPVQSRGGNSTVVLPDLPRTPDFMDANTKGTGEYGSVGRIFDNARNIRVNNPQGFINGWKLDGGIQWGDYHNSHNRVNDWINKTEEK